jgi:multimeric flavodoxin WrbA
VYALAVNGCLNAALVPLSAAGWETELVQVGGKKIEGCKACYKCWEKRDLECAQKKDIFNDFMAKAVKADALIYGSPTYFTDVSAEMKAFIDRSGMVGLANDRALRGKIGVAVVAVRRTGATHVFDSINHMFPMSQMIVPGSSYWNLGIGRDKGEVSQDAEGLTNMRCSAIPRTGWGSSVLPLGNVDSRQVTWETRFSSLRKRRDLGRSISSR